MIALFERSFDTDAPPARTKIGDYTKADAEAALGLSETTRDTGNMILIVGAVAAVAVGIGVVWWLL